MYRSNLELVNHIYDECEFILTYTSNISFETFMDNSVLKRAVERSIEIIGEAAKKLDDEFKSQHPHIKWREMAGTRNVIIHNYVGVDYEIVWQIVKEEIPELSFQARQILDAENKA